MRLLTLLMVVIATTNISFAQSPIGKWKKVSHISTYDGQTFDSHKALLTQMPCADKIVHEINADKTYRLNASASSCDDKYKRIQEKLYSESVWTVSGNKITIGHKNAPSIGQTYTFTTKGNTMIWTGTEGQGVITWQKL